MTEDIKLSKFDSEPWGFRITGGKDFGTVLTVIKVTQGSLAEASGMKVGDMLIAINDQPLSNLTHSEAHDVIVNAGNNFMLTIIRGSLVSPPVLVKEMPLPEYTEPINATETLTGDDQNSCLMHTNPQPLLSIPTENEQVLMTETQEQEQIEEELSALITTSSSKGEANPETQLSSSPIPEIHVTLPPSAINASNSDQAQREPMNEDELQEMMLNHAEIIEGNTIGVDFLKLGPKCEVIEKSEVLQAIREEKVEQAKKKISAFLQQPNRPKVKPKVMEEGPKSLPYKPLIIIPKKQQTQIQQEVERVEQQQTPGPEQQQTPEPKQQQEQGQEIQTNETGETEESSAKVNEAIQEQMTENGQVQTNEQSKEKDENIQVADENKEITATDNGGIETQLLLIHKQLSTLMQMPHTMQQQLTEVQEQLAHVLQLKTSEMHKEENNTENPELEKQDVQSVSETKEQSEEKPINEETGPNIPNTEEAQGQTENSVDQNKETGYDESEKKEIAEANISEKLESEEQVVNEIQTIADNEMEVVENEVPPKPRHDIKWQRDPPPKNKPFFPLTPKPRPVILPGGTPLSLDDELFSEDFIAETLTGNAEVIMGKAIGVNFHKFQKNYDHLKASSVYQMIHNEEKFQPAFPTRERKIASKEEYIESARAATPEESKLSDNIE